MIDVLSKSIYLCVYALVFGGLLNSFYFYLAPVGVMEILAVLVSLMISNILFIPTVIIPSRWKTPYNVPDSYNCQNPFYVHGMLNDKKESKYALPIRKNGKLKSFLFLRKIMILWLGVYFTYLGMQYLNPEIMSKLGVIESEDAFYEILYDKWREYLHRIKSGVHLIQMMGRDFTSPQDMKEHMEEIKTYMRGHNLFDIFYGRYKKEEKDLLKKYIEIAPRDEFSDILDAADSFIYFQSKTKQKDIQNETK